MTSSIMIFYNYFAMLLLYISDLDSKIKEYEETIWHI